MNSIHPLLRAILANLTHLVFRVAKTEYCNENSETLDFTLLYQDTACISWIWWYDNVRLNSNTLMYNPYLFPPVLSTTDFLSLSTFPHNFNMLSFIPNAITNLWLKQDLDILMPPSLTNKKLQFSTNFNQFSNLDLATVRLACVPYKNSDEESFIISIYWKVNISTLAGCLQGNSWKLTYFSRTYRPGKPLAHCITECYMAPGLVENEKI